MVQARRWSAGREAGQEGTAPVTGGSLAMELKRFFRGPLLLVLLAVLVITITLGWANSGSSYQQQTTGFVVKQIEQGNVKSAVLTDKNQTIQVTTKSGQQYQADYIYGQGQGMQQLLQTEYAKGQLTSYDVQIPKSSALLSILETFIPYLVIALFFFFLLSQMQGGGSRVMNFGKSKAKLMTKDTPKTTFADVAGVDEAKEELKEIKEFLQTPAKFQAIGAKIPKGVLLYGPPGTGKTLLARAVAGEAGVPFYSISGSDFVEMFVGVGASRVRDLFEQAKTNAPAIIFVDEIDAVGRHRGAGLGGGHDEREQTLNQLLVEMDGFESNEGVILVAATNRPDVLDPALLRPGRFDRRVVVGRPDVVGREAILRVHTKKIPLGDNVDLSVLARGTPGLAGADLANLVNESALNAARQNRKVVMMVDFELAKDKILMGAERKSMVMSEAEKRNTAYHEAGHALVAASLPNADPLHKVTIIPRGMALGVTMQLPIDDKHSYDKEYLLSQLAILMAGRIAEERFMHHITTGAGNDIERATDLARKMVCEWGMSELGPLSYGKKEEQIFLGREIAQHRDYSEGTAIRIDDQVKKLVQGGYDTAEAVIVQHSEALVTIAEMLLVREILDGNEVTQLIKGQTLAPQAPKETPGGSVQQVIRPDAGRRVPGLNEGSQPA